MVDLDSDIGDARLSVKPFSVNRKLRAVMQSLLALTGIAALGWFFTQTHEADKKHTRPAPVSVAPVVVRDVPLQMTSIGSVTPVNSVAVKSHVAGQILETHFKEGQAVKRGQLLFTIDPRPLQAAVSAAKADVLNKEALVAQAEAAIAKARAGIEQAKANRDKSQAVATNSQVEEQRYEYLVGQGAVSREQADQVRTNAISAKATVKADQAAIGDAKATLKSDNASLLSAKAQLEASKATLQNAEVQLGYTAITSPIDGVAGNVQILTGNLVRQDMDTLVTINQINPIYVSLTVPEQQFADLRNYAASGNIHARAMQSQGGEIADGGRLVFANNVVDAATGTVLLKVEFDNQNQRLWPGQFVNVVLTLTTTPHALVVPSQAVQTGQQGQFIWVVKPDKKVVMQPVATGQTVGGDTVITQGLSEGDSVVTDGQMLLTPGATVAPTAIKGLQ